MILRDVGLLGEIGGFPDETYGLIITYETDTDIMIDESDTE